MTIQTRRPAWRAAVAALAGTLAISGAVVLAGSSAAVEGFAFERLQGKDRYITAANIARDSFTSAQRAVLASGEERNFPDALTGNYLAGFADAPVVLTETERLPAETLRVLRDLRVQRITIIGGPAAVSTDVQRSLSSEFTVDRIEGDDRYETAARVGVTIPKSYVGSFAGRRTAILGNGQNFPDILAASPASFEAAFPITITRPTSLPAETESELRSLEIQQVIIVGGTDAVSTEVENRVRQIVGNVRRIFGSGRYETAREFADFEVNELGFVNTHVNMARGDRFPDALAGGPHAGRDRAPIILTPPTTLARAAEEFLEARDCTLRNGHIFGGFAAVSQSVEDRAEQIARTCETQPSPSPSGSASPTPTPTSTASPGPTPLSCTGTTSSPSPSPAPDSPTATMSPSPSPSPTPTTTPAPTSDTSTTVTVRPELFAVSLAAGPSVNDNGTVDTRDDFCTVSVRFTFDEAVIGKAPVAERFVLIGFDPALRFPGQTAVIQEGGRDVVVTFGRGENLATAVNERQDVGQAQLDNISLAIVDEGAVADNDQAANPIGDQPFGTTRSVPVFPAGITDAPDLVDVTVLSSNSTTNSVQFTFDENVGSIVRASGFHVVTQSNQDVTCTAPVLSGRNVTATCATTATDPIARGYVESGTVRDTADSSGDLNVLHAERVTDAALTLGPDLVSAEFRPNVRDQADDDQVLFTFDEPVFIGDNTRFQVYQADGDEIRSISATRQEDRNQVLVTFPDAVSLLIFRTPPLRNAVGVSVLEGAVIEAGDQNRPNQEDELAVLNAARNTIPAGSTNGPDLLTVRIDTDMRTATFVFDEDVVEDFLVLSRLALFRADGTRLTCTAGFSDGSEEVVCTAFQTSLTGSPQNPSDAVVGTADNAAVEDGDGNPNPEGAAVTTGGTGSPAS